MSSRMDYGTKALISSSNNQPPAKRKALTRQLAAVQSSSPVFLISFFPCFPSLFASWTLFQKVWEHRFSFIYQTLQDLKTSVLSYFTTESSASCSLSHRRWATHRKRTSIVECKQAVLASCIPQSKANTHLSARRA